MTLAEYQQKAGRTVNNNLSKNELLHHSLFEMCSELGEIHGIYQKVYQGHKIKNDHLKEEIGDLLWGIAELCIVNNFSLEEIAELNIIKLENRYPEGFEEEKSINREVG